MSDIELQRLRMEVIRLTRERDEARRAARRLDQSLELALQHATRDELTGMLNRRAGTASFHVELGRGLRTGTPTALLVLDLDGFKAVNDRLGHDRGDALLARIAQQINSALRTYDIPIRWGGDEFCIVLPNGDRLRAETVAERVLRAIRQTPFESPVSVTASCGIAVSNEAGIEELVADLDAKRGRIANISDDDYSQADVIETMISRLQRYLFKIADLRCYCAKQRADSGARITSFACHNCAKRETDCAQDRERHRIRRFYWRHDGSKWRPRLMASLARA